MSESGMDPSDWMICVGIACMTLLLVMMVMTPFVLLATIVSLPFVMIGFAVVRLIVRRIDAS